MVETKSLKIAVPVALVGAAFAFAGAMLPVFKAYAADTVPTKSGMALATTALTMAYSKQAYISSGASDVAVGARWTSDIRQLPSEAAYQTLDEGLNDDEKSHRKAHNKKIPPLNSGDADTLNAMYAGNTTRLNNIKKTIEGFSDYFHCYDALHEGEYVSEYRPEGNSSDSVNIGYYANCCGTVGQVVHMSGVDDDFPWVKVGVQAKYMHDSSRWKYVGIYDLRVDVEKEGDKTKVVDTHGSFVRHPNNDTQLFPGDILVNCSNLDMTKTKGENVYSVTSDIPWDFDATDKDPRKIATPHIFMYVGKELVQDRMTAADNAVFVESNWGTRYTHVTWGRESVAKDESVPYYCIVFRPVNSETAKNVAGSIYGNKVFNPPIGVRVTSDERDRIQKNMDAFFNKRSEYYKYAIQYENKRTGTSNQA